MNEKNDTLNLFIGPLGQAQLNAIKFISGIQQSQLLLEVISKLDTVEDLLKQDTLTGTERAVAQKIKDELEESFLSLAQSFEGYEDGHNYEKQVF